LSTVPETATAFSTPVIVTARAVLPDIDEELRLHRFTVDEYEKMSELGIIPLNARTELIEGVVIDMSPKGILHNALINQLAEFLFPLLSGEWFPSCEKTLRLSDSEPEPDIVVLRGRARDYLMRHPTPSDVGLLFEVSDSTIRFDRKDKARIYAKYGVPEYWIINLVEECVEIYLPDPKAKEPSYRLSETIKKHEPCKVMLEGKYFGEFQLAQFLPQLPNQS